MHMRDQKSRRVCQRVECMQIKIKIKILLLIFMYMPLAFVRICAILIETHPASLDMHLVKLACICSMLMHAQSLDARALFLHT